MPSAADDAIAELRFAHVIVVLALGSSRENWTKLVPDDPEVTVTCIIVSLRIGLRSIMPDVPVDASVTDCAISLSCYGLYGFQGLGAACIRGRTNPEGTKRRQH